MRARNEFVATTAAHKWGNLSLVVAWEKLDLPMQFCYIKATDKPEYRTLTLLVCVNFNYIITIFDAADNLNTDFFDHAVDERTNECKCAEWLE